MFGYQNRGQMYVFSWKKATQGTALGGMAVIRLDTGSASTDPTRNDFLHTTIPSPAHTLLTSNDIGWAQSTDYTYELIFGIGEFRILVSDGTMTLVDWTVADTTFTAGDFGFFNTSNPGTVYSASIVPEPSTALLLGLGLVGLATRQRRFGSPGTG